MLNKMFGCFRDKKSRNSEMTWLPCYYNRPRLGQAALEVQNSIGQQPVQTSASDWPAVQILVMYHPARVAQGLPEAQDWALGAGVQNLGDQRWRKRRRWRDFRQSWRMGGLSTRGEMADCIIASKYPCYFTVLDGDQKSSSVKSKEM